MKTSLHLITWILSISILSSAFQTARILGTESIENNTENKQDDPQQKLLNDLEVFFDESLKPFDALKSQEPKEGIPNLSYDLESRNTFINISCEGDDVVVALQNSYESREIILENLDINSSTSNIEKEYISDFIRHLSLIIDGPKKAFEAIAEGMGKSVYEGQVGTSSFGAVTEAVGQNRARILKENKKTDDDSHAESILFEVEYINENLKEGSDPIYGELVTIDGKFEITLVTKFFQKTYQLAVATAPYIINETTVIGNKVLEHLDSLYNLNESNKENEEHGVSLKSFEISEYMEDGLDERINTFLGEGFEVSHDDETVTINHEDAIVAEIVFSEEYVEDLGFKKVSCKLVVLANEMFYLVLPNSSIYNLKALVDKFIKEMMDHVKHATNKFNLDEAIPIFEL